MNPRVSISVLLFACSVPVVGEERLPGTEELAPSDDRSAEMVAGISKFADRLTEQSVDARRRQWSRDTSSAEAYNASVSANRQRLARYIGAVDERLPFDGLELITTTQSGSVVAESKTYSVHAVRWPVFKNVWGEGLLLRPKGKVRARVVALPDADQTPEGICGLTDDADAAAAFARRLAENGCMVVVPVLINRDDKWSGNEAVRFTNQPHREWIYRQAFEMGRHIIGYEVQKVRSVVDWFEKQGDEPILAAGYAEGGLIALYAAALDTRIDAALVSGYFSSRQRLWSEPIYRNVFGLLDEFGDAEIASLIHPRRLILEYSKSPTITGPPPERNGRRGAAPGVWSTPYFEQVKREVERAKSLVPNMRFTMVADGSNPTRTGSDAALKALLDVEVLADVQPLEVGVRKIDASARQHRQVDQLTEHTQRLLRGSQRVREQRWKTLKPSSVDEWNKITPAHREHLWNEVIGRLPEASLPPNARSRKIFDKPKWIGYEVVLDVWPDVFAWGYLLIPKDLNAGERRPVVVCQHGLEGVPNDVVTDDESQRAFRAYAAFAARLADRGFVTFAPHNPYRGRDEFRVLQRKLNPLKKSLFSVILAQHEVILDYLSGLDFVDPERIGFYGLSYGGKTAMRVPALLDRYALSICSADFNEWIKKNVSTRHRYSYMFTGEYEMFEFDLGHTYNYAEMAYMIAPRPFMVERGHNDGVAPDEWVAYEYAKIRRMYAYIGIPDSTEIEFFNGPHTIHGVGTYRFLHKHLKWPDPRER